MGSGSLVEDQRALQLALELSMLGLSSDSSDALSSFDPDSRGKKSQNTTECVPVPSSEHVAEIVGRQGEFSSFIHPSMHGCHLNPDQQQDNKRVI